MKRQIKKILRIDNKSFYFIKEEEFRPPKDLRNAPRYHPNSIISNRNSLYENQEVEIAYSFTYNNIKYSIISFTTWMQEGKITTFPNTEVYNNPYFAIVQDAELQNKPRTKRRKPSVIAEWFKT